MELSPEKPIAAILVPPFVPPREDDLRISDIGALREFIDLPAGFQDCPYLGNRR
jgi:hypothetical protein